MPQTEADNSWFFTKIQRQSSGSHLSSPRSTQVSAPSWHKDLPSSHIPEAAVKAALWPAPSHSARARKNSMTENPYVLVSYRWVQTKVYRYRIFLNVGWSTFRIIKEVCRGAHKHGPLKKKTWFGTSGPLVPLWFPTWAPNTRCKACSSWLV